MFKRNEEVVIMTTRLGRYYNNYVARYGSKNVAVSTDGQLIPLQFLEGRKFYFWSLSGKVVTVFSPATGFFRVPASLIRGIGDRNFRKGDDIYVWIPPLGERAEGPEFIPEMVRQFSKNPKTTIAFKQEGALGRWRVKKEADFGFWSLMDKWISYFPQDQAPVEIKKENEEEVFKRKKKEIRKEFDAVWEGSKKRITSDFRCSFAKILKGGGGELVVRDNFKAACHAALSDRGDKESCIYLVDFMDVHYGRPLREPFFESVQQRNASFTKAMDYWVNRGPFKRVFKTKSIPEILEYGLEYDTGHNVSAIACAAIGLRTFGEFYEKSLVFEKASERWGEHAAAIVALCSYYDSDDGFFIAYRNWHDLISGVHGAEKLYKDWVADDLEVFKLESPKMNEPDHGRYQIHNHLTPFSDKGSMEEHLPSSIEDADSIEEFLNKVEQTSFIKEVVNG